MDCPYFICYGNKCKCDITGRTVKGSRVNNYCETESYSECPDYQRGSDSEYDDDY